MAEFDPRALALVGRLESGGHRAALVGGCVRDALLGLAPHDYDCACSALPEEVMAACAPFPVHPTGLRHGTVTVVWEGLPVEVTTFRREGAYTDHRRPDRVDFTRSLEEDLARRDFTVNAMAWEQGALVDLFGGREDLARRVIRCVGKPERRFQEDALRIVRALRFAAQLDFSISPHTAAALLSALPLLSHVAQERITGELIRLLQGPGAGRVLLAYPQAAACLLPELAPAMGFDQRNPHHSFDVYTHSVHTMEGVSPTPALRLAALLHDVGKPDTFTLDADGVGHFYGHQERSAAIALETLARLRVDHATRDRAVQLVSLHSLPLTPTPRVVRRWLRRLGEEPFFQLLELQRADRAACAPAPAAEEGSLAQVEAMARDILAQAPCLTLKELAVNGRDAMAAGLEGPAIGAALNALLERVAEGELANDRAVLLPLLAQHPQPPRE